MTNESDTETDETRTDATGRALYPWEVTPGEEAVAVEVDESEDEKEAREQRASFEEDAAAASEQGGGDPAGTGTAPAAY